MSELNSLEGFRDRFWYWRGKSGARYIHSIYAPDNCPPLPGAVFVMVQKLANGQRAALEVGRFSHDWDYVEKLIKNQSIGQTDSLTHIDEIHVHLLAQSDDNAEEVVKDLVAGIGLRAVGKRSFARRRGSTSRKYSGFHEEKSPIIAGLINAAVSETPKWQPGLFDDQGADRVLASA